MFWAAGLLGLAIGVEVVATALLPRADGFTHPGWTSVVLVGYAISIWLLALVVPKIPISIAYAVWSGVGTAAIAMIGMTLLGEAANPLKIASIALIVAGVVGLNLAGAH
ncbi:MAG TPA: multidrug efflux SMR transporter [Marmoricola sp.]|nr:multidrug efflux SMR transporter [Marmoricola sp.]